MVASVGTGNNGWSPGMGSPQHLGVSCREGVREGEEFLGWEIGSPVDTDGRVDLVSKETCSRCVTSEASTGPSGLRSRCQLTLEVWSSG